MRSKKGAWGRRNYHATKTLLTSSVPELEADFEAVDEDFLGDEEGAAGGGCVFWVESVLGVSVEEGGFANARVAHDDDFGVDAMVVAGVDVGVHGGGRTGAAISALAFQVHHLTSWLARFASPGQKCHVRYSYLSTPATLPEIQTQPPSLSDGGTPTRMSQACTRVMFGLLSQGTCQNANKSVSVSFSLYQIKHIHFQQFRTIHSYTRPLANDFGRVDEILKDLFVHVRERTATRPLLLNPRITRGFAQHSALGDKNDVAIGKLLFQFSCQPAPPVNHPIIDTIKQP